MIDLALDENVFVYDGFTEALQELDILFSTEYTELINNPSFGVNLEQFLWSLTPTTSELTEYINSKLLETIYVNKYSPKVNIEFIQGEYRSIYKISISITNPNTGGVYTKKYQYQ